MLTDSITMENRGAESPSYFNNTKYEGDLVDNTIREGGPVIPQEAVNFKNPFDLLAFFDKDIADGTVIANPWQLEELDKLGSATGIASAKHPYKYVLVGSNGSGKDKFIIAPFSVWFTLCKIRSRVVITTSSGQQMSAQTEPHIRDLCQKVNAFFGQEVFRIRQRYIRCIWTGSEIRMFVTDEAGKAEGYHPIDATSEMAIIENEAKSIPDEINRALRRCSGFNYWLKISSTGEPMGHFYQAAVPADTRWPNVRFISSYDCLHVSQEEIEEDVKLDGITSAYVRSKHLSEFTSVGGQVVISLELVNELMKNPPQFEYTGTKWTDRIGIDLAAGGAENTLCKTRGNKCISEHWFREKDTTVTATRIDAKLKEWGVEKTHRYIYADDGGIGHAIIDMLEKMKWQINRINNQWPALGNTKRYGNRGAENWYRTARIFEEKLFDITNLSDKTREQLYNRYYRQTATSGKIYLEDKKEAIGHGRPSPDRADAFILSLTGLTVEDFLNDTPTKKEIRKKELELKKEVMHNEQEKYEFYENEITFGEYDPEKRRKSFGKRIYNSLRAAMRN